jgi:N-acetylmuramoyl-L-alanine amidase
MKKLLFLFLFTSIYFSQGTQHSKLDVNKINDVQYISAIDYANNSGMSHLFIETKNKIIIQYKSKKITISPNSSYLLVDDKIFNLSIPCIYDGNEFWLPLNPFSKIINSIGFPDLKLDSSEKFILLDLDQKNIIACGIEKKQNGTLIQIETNKNFDQNAISATVTRGGWLNLNIIGGSLDSLSLVNNTKMVNPVLRLRPLQLENSSQLSFLMKNDIDDYSITSNNKSIKIAIRSDKILNAQKIKEMKERWNLDVIVIDAGHGGKDPGCLKNGLMEKTVTLDVAKKLGRIIERELGIKVIYTRTEDEFIPLWKRTKIANDSGGKLFISIHVNASPSSSSARGFETFIIRPGKFDDATEVAQRENKVIELEDSQAQYPSLSKENLIIATMAQAGFTKQSEYLAGEIQNELAKRFTAPNRGVKQAGFHVLVGASMPNVLIELGFITNKNDHRLLSQSKYRKKMAEAIFDAIVTYKNEYEKNLND